MLPRAAPADNFLQINVGYFMGLQRWRLAAACCVSPPAPPNWPEEREIPDGETTFLQPQTRDVAEAGLWSSENSLPVPRFPLSVASSSTVRCGNEPKESTLTHTYLLVSYPPHCGSPPRGPGKSYQGANATYACTADWQQGWDSPQTQNIAICAFFPLQRKSFSPHVPAPTGFYIYLSLF